jgi:hypothetical protein
MLKRDYVKDGKEYQNSVDDESHDVRECGKGERHYLVQLFSEELD